MLDRFFYGFFSKVDDAVSFVETFIVRMTEWCWQTRVKLLHKKRARNVKRKR